MTSAAYAIAIHALFFGFLSAWYAERRKYQPRTWFLLGVFLGAVAPFLLYLQPDRESQTHASDPPAG